MLGEGVRQEADFGGPGRGAPARPRGRAGRTGARALGARMSRAFQRKLGSVPQEGGNSLPRAAGQTLNWQDLSRRPLARCFKSF